MKTETRKSRALEHKKLYYFYVDILKVAKKNQDQALQLAYYHFCRWCELKKKKQG